MSLARLAPWEHEILSGLSPKWRCICYESVGSTMDAAKANLKLVAKDKFGLVVAATQVAGRGRLGRGWSPSSGAFYGTFLLSYNGPLSRLSGFSLVVGLGIHRAIKKLGGVTALKWPNDILSIDDKKLGGILIEIAPHETGSVVLVGVGVNLGEVPKEYKESASLLSIGGQICIPPKFAYLAAQELESVWNIFKEKGFSSFVDEWENASCWRGDEVTVGDGEDKKLGIFTGVTAEGELLLRESGGTVKIVSGDLGKLRRI